MNNSDILPSYEPHQRGFLQLELLFSRRQRWVSAEFFFRAKASRKKAKERKARMATELRLDSALEHLATSHLANTTLRRALHRLSVLSRLRRGLQAAARGKTRRALASLWANCAALGLRRLELRARQRTLAAALGAADQPRHAARASRMPPLIRAARRPATRALRVAFEKIFAAGLQRNMASCADLRANLAVLAAEKTELLLGLEADRRLTNLGMLLRSKVDLDELQKVLMDDVELANDYHASEFIQEAKEIKLFMELGAKFKILLGKASLSPPTVEALQKFVLVYTEALELQVQQLKAILDAE